MNGTVFEATTADGSISAVRFDGSDDYIDLGVLDVNGSGLTLAVWFNADTFPGSADDPRLISKASGTSSGEHVFMLSTIQSGGVRLRARVRVRGNTSTVIGGNVGAGVWHHAAVTYDGSTLILYLDGNQVESMPLTGAVDMAPIPVMVGSQPPGAGPRFFDGLLDDVRILQRAMTASEIGEIVGSPSPPPPPPPPPPTSGEPNIDELFGNTEDGGTVVMSGQNFGSHALNIEWLGGVNGVINTLPLGSQPPDWGADWTIGISTGGLGIPELDTQKVRANRSQSIRGWKGGYSPNTINSGFIYEPGGEWDEIYVSWWTYFNPISQKADVPATGGQWKMWRMNSDIKRNSAFSNGLGEMMSSGDININTGRRKIYTGMWCGYVSHFSCSTYPNTCWPFGFPGQTYKTHPLPAVEDMNKWVRWEVYVKASSDVEVRDGKYIYTMTVPGEGKWIVDWTDQIITHRDIPNWQDYCTTWLAWTRFAWQNYCGNGLTGAKWHHDDIYIQRGTRARVEIGDQPVYANCTHREIQNPTAWSDDTISITLNHGSFSPSDKAYLFVIREDGSISQGFPVTLNDNTNVR